MENQTTLSDRLSAKEKSARKIIESIGIPPQPAVVMEVFRAIQKPDTEIHTLAAIIGRDPALAAKAIKVVNSPYFGASVAIGTIHQAVTMLGLRGFYNIILVSALKEVVLTDKNNPNLQAIWQHMVVTAKMAEFVARRLKLPSVTPEQAYLAGLFHDCALPLLEKRYPGYCHLFKDAKCSADMTRLEDERHDFNHAVIGYLMARTWNLPKETCLAIAHHHDGEYEEVSYLGDTTMWLILRLADYLGEYLCFHGDLDTFEYADFQGLTSMALSDGVLAVHGLTENDFNRLCEDALERIDLAALTG